MSDQQDPRSPQQEQPPAGEEQPKPRSRRHRRATRPATGGDAAANIPARAGRDDTDAGWAPDAAETGAAHPAERVTGRQESAQDRWWREQRPPHWE